VIKLTLPYPVSVNRYWRSYVPRGWNRALVVVSGEAKEYRRKVKLLALEAGIRDTLSGRVRVHIDLYPERPQDWRKRATRDTMHWDETVRCIDLDNARKVLYDALSGVLWVDDSQIWADSGERMEPDGEARVVVTVTQIARVSRQQDLLGEVA